MWENPFHCNEIMSTAFVAAVYEFIMVQVQCLHD